MVLNLQDEFMWRKKFCAKLIAWLPNVFKKFSADYSDIFIENLSSLRRFLLPPFCMFRRILRTFIHCTKPYCINSFKYSAVFLGAALRKRP